MHKKYIIYICVCVCIVCSHMKRTFPMHLKTEKGIWKKGVRANFVYINTCRIGVKAMDGRVAIVIFQKQAVSLKTNID